MHNFTAHLLRGTRLVEENKKCECIASFTLTTICRYLIINKMSFKYLLAFSFAVLFCNLLVWFPVMDRRKCFLANHRAAFHRK